MRLKIAALVVACGACTLLVIGASPAGDGELPEPKMTPVTAGPAVPFTGDLDGP